MTITVTREDIENGRRCDPDCCPIGRALARAGVNHFGVVGPTVMVADDDDHASGLPLPENIRKWILDFDMNRPVDPISFDLKVNDKVRLDDGSKTHTAFPTRSRSRKTRSAAIPA